jgi:tetratricopeptide (TPR) repeat protein
VTPARRAGRATPPATPPREGGRSLAIVFAVLGLLVAIGAGWLFTHGGRSRSQAPSAPSAEDARLATLAPTVAYDSAMVLARAGQHRASLPYYRRALQHRFDVMWPIHFNYASALYNYGLEIGTRNGVPLPATRSSVERVALMREAMAQLDSAERLAPGPAERAMIVRSRAERFRIWGLPWDAFTQYRTAEWIDPNEPALRQAAEGYLLQLRYPDQNWAPGSR